MRAEEGESRVTPPADGHDAASLFRPFLFSFISQRRCNNRAVVVTVRAHPPTCIAMALHAIPLSPRVSSVHHNESSAHFNIRLSLCSAIARVRRANSNAYAACKPQDKFLKER
jgi:hypothetical protein